MNKTKIYESTYFFVMSLMIVVSNVGCASASMCGQRSVFRSFCTDPARSEADFNSPEMEERRAQEQKEKRNREEEQRRALDQEIERQRWLDFQNNTEERYKMKFCRQPNLFNELYNPFGSSIESDCIYMIQGPLKVLQVIKGGILVSLIQLDPYTPDKIFFVRTGKQYIDQAHVGNIFVRSNGVTSYRTVLGANKTINAFIDLDIKK